MEPEAMSAMKEAQALATLPPSLRLLVANDYESPVTRFGSDVAVIHVVLIYIVVCATTS